MELNLCIFVKKNVLRTYRSQNSYKTLQRKEEQKLDKQLLKTKISELITLDWQI